MFLLRIIGSQHLSCIILSETFTYNMRKRALRIIVYFHFSGTYVCHAQLMYALSGNIHYSSSNIDITCKNIDVEAKISLCGHCLMNYFGLRLFSSILTFFSAFLSLSLSRYCENHVSIMTLTKFCFYRCQITEIRICHT